MGRLTIYDAITFTDPDEIFRQELIDPQPMLWIDTTLLPP